MAKRPTRASAGKSFTSVPAVEDENKQQLSSPPATPNTPNNKSSTRAASKKQTPKQVETNQATSPEIQKSTTKPGPSIKKPTKKQTLNAEAQDEGKQPANTGRKRKREAPAPKVEEDSDELPHNMGKRPSANAKIKEEEVADDKSSPKKANDAVKNTAKEERAEDAKEVIEGAKIVDEVEGPVKKKAKTATPYGLTPGRSPFPDWPHPTPEEAQTVHDLLLTEIPDERKPSIVQPDTIPPPSEQVAGCGQVPSILDALIRTLLSAATTGKNSSSSFQGLVKNFGLETKGLGKGSVDWNAVRLAPQKDVFKAIESGGLADSKSKNIKAILDMVYTDNEERRNALLKAKEAGESFTVEKEAELLLLQQGVLTLDYYHVLSTEDALNTFIKYPGIGVKTASCVALFCMQRPSFAVDTHVFRLCQYLGWVPPDNSLGPRQKKPDRNSTFSHCEVRIPDNLKYGLHQLFLNHGKKCPRCRAVTGQNSAGWADANCVIEHLVKRLGAKKGGLDNLKKASKAKKGKKANYDEDEDSEMEDLADETASDAKEEPTTSPKKSARKTRASTTPKKATPKKPSQGTKARRSAKTSKAKSAKHVDEDDGTEMSELTDAPETESEYTESAD
ncbi:hypothetical protein JMJ35_010345 [Cladonia borealis]|uniref:HhH-GPD domain-containing protein n=1 Tax=Cladonia borealis TaxID=184061 RepID=A0AA39QQJ9_9LECA|nr:hypothetical protein JMJ35_010345 [Cladonia borealis]